MLQKVKRFKDKLFGSSNFRKQQEFQTEGSGEDSEQSTSSGFVGYGLSQQGPLTEVGGSSLLRQQSRTNSTTEGHHLSTSRLNSVTNKSNKSFTVEATRVDSKSLVPPGRPALQKSTSNERGALYSFANLAASPSVGRRKSTPATLDTFLVNNPGAGSKLDNILGTKKLVFSQYFKNGVETAASEKDNSVGKRGAPTSPTGDSGTKRTATQSPMVTNATTIARQAQKAHQQTGKPLSMPKPAGLEIPSMHDLSLDGTTDTQGGLSSADYMSHMSTDMATSSGPSDVAIMQAVVAAAAHQAQSTMDDAQTARKPKLISVSPSLPASMQRRLWSLADFTVVRKMYTGYASSVYQARCNYSGDTVALKVYHLESLCELNHYQVLREIRVHASLHHQNIIHLYASFQEANDIILVQEYAENGDLYRLLHKNGGRLAERQAVEMVLAPFLHALHYLHTHGIMHRDVKPENVLFTEQWVLKLADFGLAIDLNEERAVTRAGTLDYMAPEVLRCPPKNLPQENKHLSQLHYNNSVDAWAVGVFAYELIVGYPPFSGSSQTDSVERIMHGRPDFPEKTSELARDFICAALKKHPGDRPTVIEMLHHPWVASHQRRRSVLMAPTHTRRRSSSVYASQAPAPTSYYGDVPPTCLTEEPVDMSEYTQDEIEEMIRKLQMAKAAMASNGSASSTVPNGGALVNKTVNLLRNSNMNPPRSC